MVLKWATPSCSPRGPRTPTASPGSAVPRSTTSLEKTHGWPEARRSTAFRLIRTVLNPPSSPTGEVRRSERLRRTRATPRLARCHSRQTGWKVPRYAQEQGFEMSVIATHAHQCQPAPPPSHGNPPHIPGGVRLAGNHSARGHWQVPETKAWSSRAPKLLVTSALSQRILFADRVGRKAKPRSGWGDFTTKPTCKSVPTRKRGDHLERALDVGVTGRSGSIHPLPFYRSREKGRTSPALQLFPAAQLLLTCTLMAFGLAFSFFGNVTVSTPLL